SGLEARRPGPPRRSRQPPTCVSCPRRGTAPPCWKETATGFRYVNRAATGDGITRLTLTEGLVPRPGKLEGTGKGVKLPLPSLPLLADPLVTVQLRNEAGGCWSADFSTAAVNDDGRFQAKSD